MRFLDEDVEISEGREDVSLPPFFFLRSYKSAWEASGHSQADGCVSACWFRSNEYWSNSITLIKWTSWRPQVSIKNRPLYQQVNSHNHVLIYDRREDQHRPIWECFLFWWSLFPLAASTVKLQSEFPEFTWPSDFFPHLIYWLGRTWVK